MSKRDEEASVSVSLSWLLGQADLDLRLVAGSAEGVEITWAHAIELEDPTAWLTGGELVLTTGVGLPRAAAEQRAYVERLVGVGVASLAVGTGVRYAHVPRAVVEACADGGLPLLEVPLPTPFIAITQAVARGLAAQQLQAVQRTLDHQKRAARTALRSGVPGVVGGLSRELGADVVLLDEFGVLLAASPNRPELLDSVEAARTRLEQGRRRGSLTVATDKGTLEIQTVQGRSMSRGLLAVNSSAPLDPTQRVRLNQSITLLALLLDRPRELARAYRDLGRTVLDMLLASDPVAEDAVGHLRHFGFDADDSVAMLVVNADRRAQALFDLVADRLEASGRPRVMTLSSTGAVVLVRTVDTEDITRLVASALTAEGRTDAVIGISSPLPPNRAGSGLVPAQQAAAAARRAGQQVGRFEELMLQAMLADDIVRSRISVLCAPALAPLIEGPSRDRELITSLESFLRHNGSWEAAARAVGVHRHTMRSHISRVEELTGLSLDVADNRVVLALALMTTSD
jgi:PucR family transcriptional regulator, purine catabolism regulatory protein